jgi:hypothetical protein
VKSNNLILALSFLSFFGLLNGLSWITNFNRISETYDFKSRFSCSNVVKPRWSKLLIPCACIGPDIKLDYYSCAGVSTPVIFSEIFPALMSNDNSSVFPSFKPVIMDEFYDEAMPRQSTDIGSRVNFHPLDEQKAELSEDEDLVFDLEPPRWLPVMPAVYFDLSGIVCTREEYEQSVENERMDEAPAMAPFDPQSIEREFQLYKIDQNFVIQSQQQTILSLTEELDRLLTAIPLLLQTAQHQLHLPSAQQQLPLPIPLGSRIDNGNVDTEQQQSPSIPTYQIPHPDASVSRFDYSPGSVKKRKHKRKRRGARFSRGGRPSTQICSFCISSFGTWIIFTCSCPPSILRSTLFIY